jgi:hypothetical protein
MTYPRAKLSGRKTERQRGSCWTSPMTSTPLATDSRMNATLEQEKQLASAILLQALHDLTTARHSDEARAFLFGNDRESVADRSYWIALAGLAPNALSRLEQLSTAEIKQRLHRNGKGNSHDDNDDDTTAASDDSHHHRGAAVDSLGMCPQTVGPRSVKARPIPGCRFTEGV